MVVSAEFLNRRQLVLTVVMGTSAKPGVPLYDTNVFVSAAESGLPRDTVFLCYQMRSIDPVRFVDLKGNAARRTGRLPHERMRQIDAALRLALDL